MQIYLIRNSEYQEVTYHQWLFVCELWLLVDKFFPFTSYLELILGVSIMGLAICVIFDCHKMAEQNCTKITLFLSFALFRPHQHLQLYFRRIVHKYHIWDFDVNLQVFEKESQNRHWTTLVFLWATNERHLRALMTGATQSAKPPF